MQRPHLWNTLTCQAKSKQAFNKQSNKQKTKKIEIMFYLLGATTPPIGQQSLPSKKQTSLQQTNNKLHDKTYNQNKFLFTWCNDSSNRSEILAKQFDNSILRR